MYVQVRGVEGRGSSVNTKLVLLRDLRNNLNALQERSNKFLLSLLVGRDDCWGSPLAQYILCGISPSRFTRLFFTILSIALFLNISKSEHVRPLYSFNDTTRYMKFKHNLPSEDFPRDCFLCMHAHEENRVM